MSDNLYRNQIERELTLAQQARGQGLEGKARVCARRAVGIALRRYFSIHQPQLAALSVIDLIQAFQSQAELPLNIQQICAHLLTRVDADYNLPVAADLLAEARILIDFILEDNYSHDGNI